MKPAVRPGGLPASPSGWRGRPAIAAGPRGCGGVPGGGRLVKNPGRPVADVVVVVGPGGLGLDGLEVVVGLDFFGGGAVWVGRHRPGVPR